MLLIVSSMLLVSCGGGGGSSASSSGFAPANADAFETKFVNQTITFTVLNSNSEVTGSFLSKILSNKMIQSTGESAVTYTYTYTGANSATIVSEDCTINLTFSSELVGTYTDICTDPNDPVDSSGTFTFSGSNNFAPANADAFETKFVNQTVTFTVLNSNIGNISATILPNKMITGTDGNIAYTYVNTGANSARIVELDTDNCMTEFAFNLELAGTFTSTCPGEVLSGTFVFSGLNINIKANSGNTVTTQLTAGSYLIENIGIEDGGIYDGWSAWSYTGCSDVNGCDTGAGWLSHYNITSNSVLTEVSGAILENGIYNTGTNSKRFPTALLALDNANIFKFTLSQPDTINIYIVKGTLSDNRGGISIKISSE